MRGRAAGFEWDERKARTNFADTESTSLTRHGFEDVRAITVVDEDPDEERYATIGTDALGSWSWFTLSVANA